MLTSKELYSLQKGDVIRSLCYRGMWEIVTILDIVKTAGGAMQILARDAHTGEYRVYELTPGKFNTLYLPYNPDGEP